MAGTLAQLVEQRTENPCVPGSIPGGTTKKIPSFHLGFFFSIVDTNLILLCLRTKRFNK